MYKSAPSDINDFINDYHPKQDEFSYEELCNLVTIKHSSALEREVDDTWILLAPNKSSACAKNDIQKSFHNVGIEASDKEISEMISFINSGGEDLESFNKDEFKRFMMK